MWQLHDKVKEMVEIKKRTEVADSCSCSTIGTTDVDMLKPQNVSLCFGSSSSATIQGSRNGYFSHCFCTGIIHNKHQMNLGINLTINLKKKQQKIKVCRLKRAYFFPLHWPGLRIFLIHSLLAFFKQADGLLGLLSQVLHEDPEVLIVP